MPDPHTALERSLRNLIALTKALADPRLSRDGRRQVRALPAKQAAVVAWSCAHAHCWLS